MLRGDQIVLHPIRMSLAEHFGVSLAEIDVRLTRPLASSAESSLDDPNLKLTPVVPINTRPGSARIGVAVHKNGSLLRTLYVDVEARLIKTIVKAIGTIERGQEFTSANTVTQRVPLSAQMLRSIATGVIGKRASRRISAGDIVKSYDVRDVKVDEPMVVKQRDTVRLVARKGTLRVTVSSAEALQSGRIGDMIRVRNTQSRRIVTGRINSSTEIEVSL